MRQHSVSKADILVYANSELKKNRSRCERAEKVFVMESDQRHHEI